MLNDITIIVEIFSVGKFDWKSRQGKIKWKMAFPIFKPSFNLNTVAQSLTPVDLKWSSPTSVVSWPWWCIDYLSRKNEICFGALFKISKRIVLFYYVFYHTSFCLIFLIILTADLISDDSFRFIWYVTLCTFAKEIKAYFLVTLLYKTMLNSKI